MMFSDRPLAVHQRSLPKLCALLLLSAVSVSGVPVDVDLLQLSTTTEAISSTAVPSTAAPADGVISVADDPHANPFAANAPIIDDYLRNISCSSINAGAQSAESALVAEQSKQHKELDLLLYAVHRMTKIERGLKCLKAWEQMTDVSVVYVRVLGNITKEHGDKMKNAPGGIMRPMELGRGEGNGKGMHKTAAPTTQQATCVAWKKQCGGKGYGGLTKCCDGYTCMENNETFHQCQFDAEKCDRLLLWEQCGGSNFSAAQAVPKYTKAGGAKNCDGIVASTITTAAECKTAGAVLGYPFSKTVANKAERPAGCFWDKSGGSYFNSELGASAKWGGVGAICRQAAKGNPCCGGHCAKQSEQYSLCVPGSAPTKKTYTAVTKVCKAVRLNTEVDKVVHEVNMIDLNGKSLSGEVADKACAAAHSEADALIKELPARLSEPQHKNATEYLLQAAADSCAAAKKHTVRDEAMVLAANKYTIEWCKNDLKFADETNTAPSPACYCDSYEHGATKNSPQLCRQMATGKAVCRRPTAQGSCDLGFEACATDTSLTVLGRKRKRKASLDKNKPSLEQGAAQPKETMPGVGSIAASCLKNNHAGCLFAVQHDNSCGAKIGQWPGDCTKMTKVCATAVCDKMITCKDDGSIKCEESKQAKQDEAVAESSSFNKVSSVQRSEAIGKCHDIYGTFTAAIAKLTKNITTGNSECQALTNAAQVAGKNTTSLMCPCFKHVSKKAAEEYGHCYATDADKLHGLEVYHQWKRCQPISYTENPGYCRTQQNGQGNPTKETIELGACKQKCNETAACSGYEFKPFSSSSRGVCEIHDKEVVVSGSGTNHAKSATCYLRDELGYCISANRTTWCDAFRRNCEGLCKGVYRLPTGGSTAGTPGCGVGELPLDQTMKCQLNGYTCINNKDGPQCCAGRRPETRACVPCDETVLKKATTETYTARGSCDKRHGTPATACPKGFTPGGKCPQGGLCCRAGWSKTCGEGCAKSECEKSGGAWIALDYNSNPYTCHMAAGDLLLSGTATQSSQSSGGAPQRAIDGNTNQAYSGGSCTHTAGGMGWWKLDFGAVKKVATVQVWNRADCCSDRLSGAEVFAGTSKCGSLSSSTAMQTVLCNKDASYVKVQQTSANALTLCEVKVLSAAKTTTPSARSSVAPTAKQAAGACSDDAGWKTTNGKYTCQSYQSNGWCRNGGAGPNWKSSWSWNAGINGKDARSACCACGKAKTTTPSARSSVAPTAKQAAGKHWLVVGNTAKWRHSKGNSCSDDTATTTAASNQHGSKIGVTCCNSLMSSAGSRPGCMEQVNYTTAKAHCESNGKVLCSVAQIEGGAGRGTGCKFDAYLVWTRDTCAGSSSSTQFQSSSPSAITKAPIDDAALEHNAAKPDEALPGLGQINSIAASCLKDNTAGCLFAVQHDNSCGAKIGQWPGDCTKMTKLCATAVCDKMITCKDDGGIKCEEPKAQGCSDIDGWSDVLGRSCASSGVCSDAHLMQRTSGPFAWKPATEACCQCKQKGHKSRHKAYRHKSGKSGYGKRKEELLLLEARSRTFGMKRLSPSLMKLLPVAKDASIAEIQELPTEFDERQHCADLGYHCQSFSIQDQGTCGSCWAFAASRSYSDRLCRASKGRWNTAVSEQDMLSCYKSGPFYLAGGTRVTAAAGTWTQKDGCEGGNPVNAWIQMFNETRVSRWADKYVGLGYESAQCGKHDLDGSAQFEVLSGEVYRIAAGDAAVGTMKAAIYDAGSITVSIDVYADFSTLTTGVYIKASDSYLGAHALTVLGWGIANNVGYWLVANSWGSNWGDKGYGKIRLGTDEVGIESEALYPTVKVPSVCADAKQCLNGGEFDGSCGCRCPSSSHWTGATCSTCSAACQNGGEIDTTSCTCRCQPGYFGTTCADYALYQWQQIRPDGWAELKFKWKLSSWHEGSEFVRYANTLGTGSNPVIAGSQIAAANAEGEATGYANPTTGYVPGYPKAIFYALHLSLGTNEYGASRGFEVVDLPAMYYDSDNACVKGGNLPDATSTAPKCVGAYTSSPSLAQASSSAPVELMSSTTPTEAPVPTSTPTTLTPTAGPTTSGPTSVLPTGSPTAMPTHTPTELPSTLSPTTTDVPSFSPTEAPTEAPTAVPTVTPTEVPTTYPPTSAVPTEVPTAAPTHTPTHLPSTLLPTTTDVPSFAPTMTPTDEPTAMPTVTPTEAPTAMPSTAMPTTLAPTGMPRSLAPTTLSPTNTDQPTAVPTAEPSDAPSLMPTLPPTVTPTELPSTLSPTTTDVPSFAPTMTPTEPPTAVPTESPTTLAPTEIPTAFPTETPTELPSTLPPTTTDVPSFTPTITPTEAPTTEPSFTPTEPPTAVPTEAPTVRCHATITEGYESTAASHVTGSGGNSKVASQEECCQRCENSVDSDCEGWTFEPSDGSCYLVKWTGPPQTQRAQDRVVGVMTQWVAIRARSSEPPTSTPTPSPTQRPTRAPSCPPGSRWDFGARFCRFPHPTPQPTEEPTLVPTEIPTAFPTETPTELPTTLPPTTNEPSFTPTRTPTEVPTKVPTPVPSESPTTLPPTVEPVTMAPTTAHPTGRPTANPTRHPTLDPTRPPTMPPTFPPTSDPTRHPTLVPTTLHPTMWYHYRTPVPTTATPTRAPTEVPTPTPTQAPTEVPTTPPTRAPTEVPTVQPTANPTMVPTTLTPTTDEPSFAPSADPTVKPTSAPTDAPTEVPTATPTNPPSEEPTATPTETPTSEAPTATPTGTPTTAAPVASVAGATTVSRGTSANTTSSGVIANAPASSVGNAVNAMSNSTVAPSEPPTTAYPTPTPSTAAPTPPTVAPTPSPSKPPREKKPDAKTCARIDTACRGKTCCEGLTCDGANTGKCKPAEGAQCIMKGQQCGGAFKAFQTQFECCSPHYCYGNNWYMACR